MPILIMYYVIMGIICLPFVLAIVEEFEENTNDRVTYRHHHHHHHNSRKRR